MPSVHVCWSVLVAWAVITASTSRWRWLILAHPIVTVFVVVATGNHYWADAIVAVAIAGVVLAAQALLRARLAGFRRAASGKHAYAGAVRPVAGRGRQRGREAGQPAVRRRRLSVGQRRSAVSRSRCDSFSGLRTE